MAMKRKDLTGQKFGRLTALRPVGNSKDRHIMWECFCACGNITNVVSNSLAKGRSNSCGCLNIDRLIETHVSHGHSIGVTSGEKMDQEYSVFKSKHAIWARKNRTNSGYGFDESYSIDEAMKDVGRRPEGRYSSGKSAYALTTIDDRKGWARGNLKWVTPKELRLKNNDGTTRMKYDEVPNPIGEFKRLFFDIETSPHVSNIKIFGNVNRPLDGFKIGYDNLIQFGQILGIGWKWEDDKTTKYADYTDLKMLDKFAKDFNKATEVVGHNVARFDIPWVRGEALTSKIDVTRLFKARDTLTDSRKFTMPSHKLGDLLKYLGTNQQKLEADKDLWERVQQKDKKALMEMKKYCKGDVVGCEELFHILKLHSPTKTHKGVYEGKHKWSCPLCGHEHINEDNGRFEVSPAGYTTKRHVRCQECSYRFQISETTFKKYGRFLQEVKKAISTKLPSAKKGNV